jgi:hypothetical protein
LYAKLIKANQKLTFFTFYEKGITLDLVCGHRSIQVFDVGETGQGAQAFLFKVGGIFDHPKGKTFCVVLRS